MKTTTEEPTIEELEAMLAKKKSARKKKEERERLAYEKSRDEMIEILLETASDLAGKMSQFKEGCHSALNGHQLKLEEYGKIRSSSKGGFSLTHSDGTMRVVRTRDTEPTWDERATKAVDLIKSFLQDKIKHQDKKLFEILMGFLERNKKGDLEYSKVFGLLKHRDKYDDERWVEGLRLLEQSYSTSLKGYGYLFQRKGSEGKWVSMTLNFSAL